MYWIIYGEGMATWSDECKSINRKGIQVQAGNSSLGGRYSVITYVSCPGNQHQQFIDSDRLGTVHLAKTERGKYLPLLFSMIL